MKPKLVVTVALVFLLQLTVVSRADQTNDSPNLSEVVGAKARMGDREAQAELGAMYRDGRGVEKDFVEAYAWLNLAARFDDKLAKERDALEAKMTPQQIADAQKLTKELKIAIDDKSQLGANFTKTNLAAAAPNSGNTETNKRSAEVKAVRPNGVIREASIGGSIFKEERTRPLPNVFGKPDIFGRKVYAGYIELRYQGLTDDGLIILQRTEVDTQSNETTMSRSGQSHFQAQTDRNGVTRGSITHPPQGSTQSLPPNTTQFTFDPTKETELSIAGYRIRFLDFNERRLKYSYAK